MSVVPVRSICDVREGGFTPHLHCFDFFHFYLGKYHKYHIEL